MREKGESMMRKTKEGREGLVNNGCCCWSDISIFSLSTDAKEKYAGEEYSGGIGGF